MRVVMEVTQLDPGLRRGDRQEACDDDQM
jgi:hypothetical protein